MAESGTFQNEYADYRVIGPPINPQSTVPKRADEPRSGEQRLAQSFDNLSSFDKLLNLVLITYQGAISTP